MLKIKNQPQDKKDTANFQIICSTTKAMERDDEMRREIENFAKELRDNHIALWKAMIANPPPTEALSLSGWMDKLVSFYATRLMEGKEEVVDESEIHRYKYIKLLMKVLRCDLPIWDLFNMGNLWNLRNIFANMHLKWFINTMKKQRNSCNQANYNKLLLNHGMYCYNLGNKNINLQKFLLSSSN